MKNKKGLTLVEVVIALAIFSITVVMVYPILTFAGKTNIHTQNQLVAQEMGTFMAETLNYSASRYDNRDEFILSLIDSERGLCVDDLCLHGLEISPFQRDATGYKLVTQQTYDSKKNLIKDMTVTLDFNSLADPESNNNVVKVEVRKDEAFFETYEWLLYR